MKRFFRLFGCIFLGGGAWCAYAYHMCKGADPMCDSGVSMSAPLYEFFAWIFILLGLLLVLASSIERSINRHSAPRQPPEDPPPAKPGSAAQ